MAQSDGALTPTFDPQHPSTNKHRQALSTLHPGVKHWTADYSTEPIPSEVGPGPLDHMCGTNENVLFPSPRMWVKGEIVLCRLPASSGKSWALQSHTPSQARGSGNVLDVLKADFESAKS